MIPCNVYPAGTVIPIFFTTYGKTNGESITLSGLAVTDIEIYKGTSMTQRSSDNGYTLLDTDGIDIDSVTGLHGFSIDTGDNTDAGFYAAGSIYHVVVSTVTIDSQTVTFIADRFRLVAAEATAGYPAVTIKVGTGTGEINLSSGVAPANVTQFGGSNGTFASGRPEVNASHIAGSAVSTSSAQIGVNVVNAAGTAWGSGAITAASIASNAITSAKVATDAIGAAQLAADAVTEIQSGLATSANQTTIIGYIDTEVASILAVVDTEVAAIKAKTDNLPAAPAATGDIPSAATVATAVLTTAMTEAYAADGATFTVAQALYEIAQSIGDFSISGTTLTVKKRDGSTTAMTYTLNDGTSPTSRTRAT